MKTNSPNETPETNPFYLASQAEYVLAAIDEGHPGRNALWAVLAVSNGRLSDILQAVKAEDAPQTWDGLVDPLEAASIDLHHALALFEAVHGDEDDPAMEAVGTLLRMAKSSLDEMINGVVSRLPTADHKPEEVAYSYPEKATTEVDFMAGVALGIELVREGEKHWNTDDAEFRAENREGAPQKDVAAPFLSRLVSDPALLPGFSAVLSSVVGVGNGLHGDSFAGIGYREIIGGGANGNRAGKAAARAARSVKNKGAEVAA